MKRLACACAVAAGLAASAPAAAQTWTVDSLGAIGCAASATFFSTTVAGVSGGISWRTIVNAGGQRDMDELLSGAEDGPYTWNLYPSTSGGPTDGTWPIVAGTPVVVDFFLESTATGQPVFHRRVTLTRCDGGGIASDVVLPVVFTAAPALGLPGLAALAGLLALGGFVLARRRQA